MAPQTARSVDRALKKMMKQAARPAATAASSANGSVSTAAHALAQMAEVQKRLARGDTAAARALATKPLGPPNFAAGSATASAPAGATPAGEPAATSPGKRPGLTAIVVGSVAAAVVVAAATVWMLAGGANHSVTGTVMLDQRPLAHAEVIFHPMTGAAAPIRVTSSAQGAFRVTSLPAGEYAIVLSAADTAEKLPRHYRSPESTPFRLKLTKSRSDLRMLASSGDSK